jgi:hypothetical protein
MERTGLALRLGRMWFDRTDDRRAWSGLGLDSQKRNNHSSSHQPRLSMTVGNGATEKFWEDRWIQGLSISEITPALYACIPKRRRKSRTVADGLHANRWAQDIQGVLGIHEIGQYLQVWQLLTSITLTDEPDMLVGDGWQAASTPHNRPSSSPSREPLHAGLGSSSGDRGHLCASNSSIGSPTLIAAVLLTALNIANANTTQDAPCASKYWSQ